MSKVNPTVIFDSMKSQNPIPEAAEAMIRFICDAAPTLFEVWLDRPFDLKSYAEVKLAYLRWMLQDEAFLAKFGETLDDATWGMWRQLYENLIEQLQAIVDDEAAFSRKTGMTTQHLIAKMGLVPSLAKKFAAGKLTVSDVLMEQPGLILDNTK